MLPVSQVARTATVVNKLDFTSDFLDSLSNDASTSVPEAFESTFAQLAPYIHKRYSIFEAPRPQVSSTRVLVVFGPGAGALARAATKRGVHVIVVRLYRPWSAKHFVHALPQAVRQLTRGQRWTIGVATLSGRASVLDALVGDVISTLTSTAHWNGPAPSVVKFSLAPNAHGVTSGMANEVTETLLSATRSAAVKIDPSNSHSHKLSSIEAGYVVASRVHRFTSTHIRMTHQVFDFSVGYTRSRCTSYGCPRCHRIIGVLRSCAPATFCC